MSGAGTGLSALVLSISLAACTPVASLRISPQARPLGSGVTLVMHNVGRAPFLRAGAIVPIWVKLTNDGLTPIKIAYRDFSLVSPETARSLALLPSELANERPSSGLLREGLLDPGATESGVLYFHLPPSAASPTLRVDLQAASDLPISQSFIPLVAPVGT